MSQLGSQFPLLVHNECIKSCHSKQVLFLTSDHVETSAFLKKCKGHIGLLIWEGVLYL